MPRRNMTIADDIIQVLPERRIHLFLQPIVSAKTGQQALHACLIRMQEADGGLFNAGEFIPIAEKLGLWRLIDARTLELAVELLKTHAQLNLAINVSSHTTSDREWLAKLRKFMEASPERARRLMIEIAETAAIHDINQTIYFVDAVKELGCRVAIDDFGAGYTSFRNLKALNVDMVKIDGSFVANLAQDAGDQVFIKAMIDVAEALKIETVAEWVGDEKGAPILARAGVGYLQGNYFGMPVAPDELALGGMGETADRRTQR
ncbi:MAG: EAL domain-containing protein [Hyphomicrobium sp.]